MEINFFDNLPVRKILSNVYLPKNISICPKKKGILSFEINLEKSTEFAKYAYGTVVSRIKFLCAIVKIMWCNK